MAQPTQPKTIETNQQRYVKQEVAAERWSVSVDTIRRMISSGKITGYRLNRRIVRVDLAEVDAAFNVIAVA